MPQQHTNPSRLLPPHALDKLNRLELVARAMVEGTLTGLHRSPYHGFSSEFSEYRKYCPGDAVKQVDWVAYARTDRYFVKQYEEETNTRTYVMLDHSGSMGFGGPPTPKFDYARHLAAAFIYLMHRQKDAVGLFTYTDRVTSYLPAAHARLHMLKLFSRIEQLTPGGPSAAAGCFHRMAEEVHRRSIVILLSDLFDPDPAFISGLRHFRHKGCEVILFRILDPAEARFPYRGLVEFRDLETQETLEVESETCRADYLADLHAHTQKLKRACGQMNIAFEALDTGTPFVRALLAYFHKRERLF